ncbi:MAG: 16S rRNA (cytidine(1402)-2'-O)-methyltransferase [Candidatus Omnitrophica bacterium]|nr:16S rRNA (cytidine(1402)-2'-O)-methyltransferase [Candidatus Omnitrophota bacterium]
MSTSPATWPNPLLWNNVLYIVSTPIGNLKDITLRALEVLKSVDLIAAEDTRHTGVLCKEYGITARLTSYFDHNESGKARELVNLLKEGRNIALVSDAGTPGINDPGYRLVSLAKAEGVAMAVIPGACAAIAALSLSALPTDRFAFYGFLPVKPGARRKKILQAAEAGGTAIFYESPHRLLKTLKDIAEVMPEQIITVARELTKKFEERLDGPAGTLLDHFTRHKPLGEFVILFHCATAN